MKKINEPCGGSPKGNWTNSVNHRTAIEFLFKEVVE